MSMPQENPTPKMTIPRVSSGIPGFDDLVEGGLVKNSVVLVQGDTGTTKTLFSLQYLYNGCMVYNEPGVFISFTESVNALKQHAKMFSWDLDHLIDAGSLAIIEYSPHEVVNIIAEGGGTIRDTIESTGAKRLVIDSLTAYSLVFESRYKANESILDLFDLLRKWDTTSLVTAEVSVNYKHPLEGMLGFLTDGIVNLYHTRTSTSPLREIEIVKMRDTAHNEKIHVFNLSKRGLFVLPRIDDVEKSPIER